MHNIKKLIESVGWWTSNEFLDSNKNPIEINWAAAWNLEIERIFCGLFFGLKIAIVLELLT